MGRLVRGPGYTLMVHRDGSLRSRELRVPLWIVRVGLVLLVAGVLGVLLVVATYGPIVTAAAREPLLCSRWRVSPRRTGASPNWPPRLMRRKRATRN